MEARLGTIPIYIARNAFHCNRIFDKGVVRQNLKDSVSSMRSLPEMVSEDTDFCDLLMNMLHFDPKKRLRADEALKHPYFTKVSPSSASTHNNTNKAAVTPMIPNKNDIHQVAVEHQLKNMRIERKSGSPSPLSDAHLCNPHHIPKTAAAEAHNCPGYNHQYKANDQPAKCPQMVEPTDRTYTIRHTPQNTPAAPLKADRLSGDTMGGTSNQTAYTTGHAALYPNPSNGADVNGVGAQQHWASPSVSYNGSVSFKDRMESRAAIGGGLQAGRCDPSKMPVAGRASHHRGRSGITNNIW